MAFIRLVSYIFIVTCIEIMGARHPVKLYLFEGLGRAGSKQLGSGRVGWGGCLMEGRGGIGPE